MAGFLPLRAWPDGAATYFTSTLALTLSPTLIERVLFFNVTSSGGTCTAAVTVCLPALPLCLV
jgi:hypothetical protein